MPRPPFIDLTSYSSDQVQAISSYSDDLFTLLQREEQGNSHEVIQKNKPVKIGKKKNTTRIFSHSIRFIDISSPKNLTPEEKKILDDLVQQQLEEEDNRKKNKDALLNNAYYPLYTESKELNSLIVLSHGISRRLSKTGDEESVVYDVRSNAAMSVKAVDENDNKKICEAGSGFKKYISRKPPKNLISWHSKIQNVTVDHEKKIIYCPEDKMDCIVEGTIWSFETGKCKGDIQIKEKEHVTKTYIFQPIKDDENKERVKKKREKKHKRIENEQIWEDKASNKKSVTLTNRKPVTIRNSEDEITEMRVMEHLAEGFSIEEYEEYQYSGFNYGEALTIAVEVVASLRELYRRAGPTFVQGDFHPGNIIYNQIEQKIDIIDFNYSGEDGQIRDIIGIEGYRKSDEAKNCLKDIIERYGNPSEENICKALNQELTLLVKDYPDSIFYLGFLKKELKSIREIIKTGLESENEDELNYNEAKEKIKNLEKNYSIIFPSRWDDPDDLLTASELFEIVFFHVSLLRVKKKIEEKNPEKSLYRDNFVNALLLRNFEDENFTKLKNALVALKKEFPELKIEEMEDQQLTSFFKNYFQYKDAIKIEVREKMSRRQDTYQMGLTLKDIFLKCKKLDRQHSYSKTHKQILELINYKIETNEQLNKVQLNFCYDQICQLQKDIQALNKLLEETKVNINEKKTRYNGHKKYDSYRLLEEKINEQNSEIESIDNSVISLLPEIQWNIHSDCSDEKTNEILEKTRNIKFAYDERYTELYKLFYNSDQDISEVLGKRRLGWKSALAVVTRPFSFVMGILEKHLGNDKNHWLDDGFEITRPLSSSDFFKMRKSFEEAGHNSQSLSPLMRSKLGSC